ncbi:MAG: DEAD/DEAH box helicase, partial [Planctomycetota bacterium]|nr:DEAD/DEAH box helicase [Planctomycetota bacterium]
MEYKGLKLDRFQLDAIAHIDAGENVIVSAPTGAGKTLIAEYALESAVNARRHIIYTAPIKALSNQKFRDFTADYGDRIGIMTGDVTINPAAIALIMTTEIFRNTIFESPARLENVGYVIFDEIHFMDDEERGTVWEESIIFAPHHIRFLCLSATVANLPQFAAWMEKTRRSKVQVVFTDSRPVPLTHTLWAQGVGATSLKGLKELEIARRAELQARRTGRRNFRDARSGWRGRRQGRHGRQGQADGGRGGSEPGRVPVMDPEWRTHLIDHIQKAGQMPCLYFLFSRRGCEERARESMGRGLLSDDDRMKAHALFDSLAVRFDIVGVQQADEMRALVGRGIAYHHAGILPTLKEVVERLFTSGFIRLLFATETFAL